MDEACSYFLDVTSDMIEKYGEQPKSAKQHNKLEEAPRRRTVDSSIISQSTLEPPIASDHTESTYVESRPLRGNRFLRWLVRNWLEPVTRRRDSLIQVGSSDEHESTDVEQQQYEDKDDAPNEIPHTSGLVDTDEPSEPMSLPSAAPLSVSDPSDTAGRTRPLSEGSYQYTTPSSVPSRTSSQRPSSSIIIDTLSPQIHPTVGSTLYTPSIPTSSQNTPRRRRPTASGREIYHDL
ncbi:unnamed protein product [Umbelopsis sp. WA50703]